MGPIRIGGRRRKLETGTRKLRGRWSAAFTPLHRTERDCAESQSQHGALPALCGWSSTQPRSNSQHERYPPRLTHPSQPCSLKKHLEPRNTRSTRKPVGVGVLASDALFVCLVFFVVPTAPFGLECRARKAPAADCGTPSGEPCDPFTRPTPSWKLAVHDDLLDWTAPRARVVG